MLRNGVCGADMLPVCRPSIGDRFPTGLAGIAAITALVFARSAVRAARATIEQQAVQIETLERAEADRQETRRSQYAAKFVCWITLSPSPSRVVSVGLVNSNEVPFYQVVVYVGTPRGVSRAAYNFVGPLSGRRTMGRASRALQALLPDGEPEALISSGELWVAMTFRDPAGNWWCRTPAGLLLPAVDEASAHDICQRAISST
ncbi:hypothetical protein [Pseudonocardia sp. TRM90224]|uniref:hypothetical protein n=1 Tax=Pseudonocardia sp. TRM90224 TaxID=2812678 RepID=UPI001E64866B|nr:hypothetical protein [Pseudonocardia sp. TRM90224]